VRATDVSLRVRELVEPLLADRGLEVVDVEQSATKLRITIDRSDGAAVDLDTIALASEQVSHALDRADPIPGRYTLEVSSPGVERPLRTPDHFRRVVGATVALRTRPGTDGERRVEGTLEAADDEGVRVAGRTLPYRDIERARTVFTWGAGDRRAPGKRSRR
jgi:ribosome maturation factor RimP